MLALLLILWGKVAALTGDVKISVMLLSRRILRKDVFYSQNVMPFKQVNRKSTLLTREVLQYLSCQLCSDLLWKVIRYDVLQKTVFFFSCVTESQERCDTWSV